MNKLKKWAAVAAAAQSTPTKARKAFPTPQATTTPRTKEGTATPENGKGKATENVNEDESMAEASDAAMSSSKAHLNLASLTPNTN